MISLSNLLEFIYPSKCLCCHTLINGNDSLCAVCWSQLEFIGNPLCKKCGCPFEYEQEKNALCTKCLAEPPKYHSSRSACQYNEIFRKLITDFKYYDKTIYQRTFAKWLYLAGKDMLQNSNLIIPVPLYRKRLFKRRYNQSCLLAKELSSLTNIPTNFNILHRKKATSSQTYLTRNIRLKNVKTAFTIAKKYNHLVRGKNIILIDDVITTGATINACSELLLKHKAKRVNALTIARTPKHNSRHS